VSVEMYPDERKLGAQLKYADRRGHRFAVIIGDGEWATGTAQLKDMASGESLEVAVDGLAEHIVGLVRTAGREQGEG
jgi:histidyl-tRNA synthetase